jgi:hypothetical protein
MLTPKVMGWAGVPVLANHHGEMARDALEGLGWSNEMIGSIPEYANNVDIDLPHCEYSNHRLTRYQEEFERYGGDKCVFNGAEWSAEIYIRAAREFYEAGNIAMAEQNLGYAIHFIQDAFCPPHIFPFSEHPTHGWGIAPHLRFEIYTSSNYGFRNWQERVKIAEPFIIMSPEDLLNLTTTLAANIRFSQEQRVRYVRQDGTPVNDPPWVGWYMSDEDIGEWMEKAASVVKGAAKWAFPREYYAADVAVQKHGPFEVEQGDNLQLRIDYFNMEEGTARNVILTDYLASQVGFVSASEGGTYDAARHCVRWDIGTLECFSTGSVTLVVSVPSSVQVGTILRNVANISTSSSEYDESNNQNTVLTTVVEPPPPVPDLYVDGGTLGGSGSFPTLRVRWGSQVRFVYHGDETVVSVKIRILLSDGTSIRKPMTRIPETYDWSFTYTFYKSGWTEITYEVSYATGHIAIESHKIYILFYDPSGFVYNALTRERIQGATVTLLRFDLAVKQFVEVSSDDAGIDPHVNPQVTDEIGGYGWMVSLGIYMVRAEKQGYTTNFALASVPPPATDVNIPLTPIDVTAPTTSISCREPIYRDILDNTYVTSATLFTLIAEDNIDGSGVASTSYRIYNTLTYDTGWLTYDEPFNLKEIADGTYIIDYNSTDVAGNVEPTKTAAVVLDNTVPSVTMLNPPSGCALQDGVTFIVSADDSGSGVSSLNFSIREADGAEGKPVSFEDFPVVYNATMDKWTLLFDTLQLPDGYYIVIVKAKDNLGNIGSTIVPYSFRNWAVIELLPASETNKAGRTMPVKFSLRVSASVDPNQPFVYNEELVIKIYATDDPSNILQTSTFGDTARDYRINTLSEHYITNFQTLKTPKTYRVEIWRKDMLIGWFEFSTVK